MRKVMRWRYYCDFCKKSGGNSLATHEVSCTLNPNRVCRMHKYVDGCQRPIAELIALLPRIEEVGDGWYEIPKENMERLRDGADGCPVCMMAALRQSGLPAGCATSFDFKAEMASFWTDINPSRYE